MAESNSLPLLLRTVLNDLECDYIRAGAGNSVMPSLDLWFNLLRAIDRSGVERSELPQSLRLSKRAVRTRIATATRHGWTEEVALGRGKALVRLTEKGLQVSAHWRSVEAIAERTRREQIGTEPVDRLHAASAEVVSALPLEHPHYPASYGRADASITGGHGADWEAVQRPKADVAGLSLIALISQLLVAFAMAYEEKSPIALTLSSSVIMRIPAEGTRVRGLGNPVGVSALVRHGFLRLSGEGREKLTHLTPSGIAVRNAHEERIHAVETAWRKQFGERRLAALRSELEQFLSCPSVRGT